MAGIPLPRPRPEILEPFPGYENLREAPLDDRRDQGLVQGLLSVLAENMGVNDAMDIYKNGFQSYADKRYQPFVTPGPSPLGRQAGMNEIDAAIKDPALRPALMMNPLAADDPATTDPAELLAYGQIDNPMGDQY